MTDDQHDNAGTRSERTPSGTPSDMALVHGDLRDYFEHIERALNKGDLHIGAELLGMLIDQARQHFHDEENAARNAGLSILHLRHLQHDALIERARLLRAKCLSSSTSRELCRRIEAEVVGFLSDVLEDELVTERMISARNTVANDH